MANDQNNTQEDTTKDTFKVISGRFVDEKGTEYKFGQTVKLTKAQIEKYTKQNLFGVVFK